MACRLSFTVLGILSIISSATGYSSGAPACTKVPNHGGNTRFSRRSPHEITFPNGEVCYHSGQIIDVEIGGGSRNGFHGFTFFVNNILHSSILQQSHTDKYRVWESHRCVGATHKNSAGKSKVLLKWQAPSDGISVAQFSTTTFTKTGNGFQRGTYYRSKVVNLPKCALPNATQVAGEGKRFNCGTLTDDWPNWCPNNKENCDQHTINCARTCCEHKGAAALISGNKAVQRIPCPREDRFEGWCQSKTNRCDQDIIRTDYCRKTCCLFLEKNN